MIYGYIRVSTDKQTVENQRYEIEGYCHKHNLVIYKYIEETISGAKSYNKRRLGKLLHILKKGDTLIASELSRLGRTLYMIMDILNYCMTKGCNIITIKDNFILKDDIESKVLAFAFGLSAEIERKLISQRTKEALDRLRKEGKVLGRPKGSKKKHPKLENKDNIIIKYLNNNRTIKWISKKLSVHPNTLSRYIQKNNLKKCNEITFIY